MKRELNTTVASVIVGLIVIAIVVLFIKSQSTPVVKASDIKAPAPPGGFPKASGQHTAPAGPGAVPQPLD